MMGPATLYRAIDQTGALPRSHLKESEGSKSNAHPVQYPARGDNPEFRTCCDGHAERRSREAHTAVPGKNDTHRTQHFGRVDHCGWEGRGDGSYFRNSPKNGGA